MVRSPWSGRICFFGSHATARWLFLGCSGFFAPSGQARRDAALSPCGHRKRAILRKSALRRVNGGPALPPGERAVCIIARLFNQAEGVSRSDQDLSIR
jgi:hypothetical protein